jgi:hypothetical protein
VQQKLLLHRARWGVGDARFGSKDALAWYVTGGNGENSVNAQGATRTEAYWRVYLQAQEVGMLAPLQPEGIMSGIDRAPRSPQP